VEQQHLPLERSTGDEDATPFDTRVLVTLRQLMAAVIIAVAEAQTEERRHGQRTGI
jgi:hypothetical protein